MSRVVLQDETYTLHAYMKCRVLEGEYAGQEVECSGAVNSDFKLTSLSTGYEAPKHLVVEFIADGKPPITARLAFKRIWGQIALYEYYGRE